MDLAVKCLRDRGIEQKNLMTGSRGRLDVNPRLQSMIQVFFNSEESNKSTNLVKQCI